MFIVQSLFDFVAAIVAVANFSIPIPLDRFVDALEESVNKFKQSRGSPEQKPKSSGKTIKAIVIIIIIGACFYWRTGFSSDATALNDLHCELICSKFKNAFRDYVKDNKIKKVEDFKLEDFQYLKNELWTIIRKARKDFSKTKQKPVIDRVKKIYNYEAFSVNFDMFVDSHKTGSLEDFERDFDKYIKGVQGRLYENVFE